VKGIAPARSEKFKRSVSRFAAKASEFPEKILGRLRPLKPYDFLKAQPPPLEDLLPYVGWIEEHGRSLFILTDGGVGLAWKIEPVGHEMLTEDALEKVGSAVAQIFSKVTDKRVSFQIIYDAKPARDVTLPDYYDAPQTAPQRFQKARIDTLLQMAQTPAHRIRLMERRVYLTLRIENSKHPYNVANEALDSSKTELDGALALLSGMATLAASYASEVEYVLSSAGLPFESVSANQFLGFLRETFHGLKETREDSSIHEARAHLLSSLSAQVARGFVDFTPSVVGTGSDAWEVISWADQPSVVHAGLLSHLVALDVPHRAVINVRPCPTLVDLERMRALLRNADDAYGEMQREEVKATQDSVARGEILSHVSIHVLVRNEGSSVHDVMLGGRAPAVASVLQTATQIPWVVEKHAAPALFLLALPFGYSKMAAGFSGRERRVLSRNLGPFLPIYGTFGGTRTPCQYMVSRAGGLVTLDSRDCETSPHTAILGSSGAGKSFFMANKAMAFAAQNRRSFIFAIDKATSYRVLAQVIGEETGFQIVEPPKVYPNIFRGRYDEFRLPVLVGILRTAISLVSPDAKLGAIEEMLLAESIKLAYEQVELEAGTEYTDGRLHAKLVERIRIPRLADVVENLYPVAARSEVPKSTPETLRALLSPFLGSGPYAQLFDREEFEDADVNTPGFSLYDLDGLSGNPILTTIVTQCILAEILRQLRKPENRGVPGMLIVEEVGVLAGESPELVVFIRDAWKRFRKLGVECVGLTNQVKDYLELPGPREIWSVSPNKIILRMLEQDLAIAKAAYAEGKPSIFSNPYHFEIAASLKKVDGRYSDGFWLGDEVKGTFTYMPTGTDYWCAASKPIELDSVDLIARKLGSVAMAVERLGAAFPSGVRGPSGNLRSLSQDEVEKLLYQGVSA